MYTTLDVEQVLERGQWIALAGAAITALLYYQSPYTALTFCIFTGLAGCAIRSGSRLFATALPIALLSLASSRYEFYVGFDLAAMVWRFTGILLVLGALRAAWSPRCRELRRQQRVKRAAFSLLAIASAPLALVLLVPSFFIIRYSTGYTSQMEPTVHGTDEFIAVKQQWVGSPHRGDIVVFEPFADHVNVGRVVGLPGDRIQIRSGELIRNGVKIEEPYLRSRRSSPEGDFPMAANSAPLGPRRNLAEQIYGHNFHQNKPFLVPAESYFVAVDDRTTLVDSRLYGAVPADQLRGRVLFARDANAPAWLPAHLVH